MPANSNSPSSQSPLHPSFNSVSIYHLAWLLLALRCLCDSHVYEAQARFSHRLIGETMLGFAFIGRR